MLCRFPLNNAGTIAINAINVNTFFLMIFNFMDCFSSYDFSRFSSDFCFAALQSIFL